MCLERQHIAVFLGYDRDVSCEIMLIKGNLLASALKFIRFMWLNLRRCGDCIVNTAGQFCLTA